MQISTCARLPSSHAFARLSLRRQAVVGKKTSSSSPQQKAGVSSARNPAQSGFRSNGRKLKCKAATEDVDDIIDVEGKTIDDRIPVTVRRPFPSLHYLVEIFISLSSFISDTGTPAHCFSFYLFLATGYYWLLR